MSDAIDSLLAESAITKSSPGPNFLAAVGECWGFLRDRFPAYSQFIQRRANGNIGPFECLRDVHKIPALYLPVLKQIPFKLPKDFEIAETLTSSGTSGVPSRIPLDRENMDRRVAAMSRMYQAMGIVSGPTRAWHFCWTLPRREWRGLL